jgi:glyoxylase-like metal-dependent hydrolase (beta-lactamase superfamily II)
MRKLYDDVRQYADSLEDEHCSALEDEAELEFETGSLRVIHTPGHTPGSCSFLREADRTVIAGDCVLKRVTPNPILSPDPIDPTRRFRSLAEYLVSLARVRSFSPTLILGGHGDPVHDYEELLIVTARDSRASDSDYSPFPKTALPHEVARAIPRMRRCAPVPGSFGSGRLIKPAENKIALELSDDRDFYRKLGSE